MSKTEDREALWLAIRQHVIRVSKTREGVTEKVHQMDDTLVWILGEMIKEIDGLYEKVYDLEERLGQEQKRRW